MFHGRVPRVPQNSGDHHSSSSAMHNIKPSPYTSAELQHLLVLHNQVGMMKVGTQNVD